MLAPLTIFGLFTAVAWVSQAYLNRLIAADIQYIKSLEARPRLTLDSSSLSNCHDDATPDLY
jgi:hypothetical protein